MTNMCLIRILQVQANISDHQFMEGHGAALSKGWAIGEILKVNIFLLGRARVGFMSGKGSESATSEKEGIESIRFLCICDGCRTASKG